MRLKVTVDQVPYEIDVEVAEKESATLGAIVIGGGGSVTVAAPSGGGAGAGAASANAVVAPLAGSVNRVLVEVGQEVAEGDVVLVLEAMKMETEITAPKAGKVSAVLVAKGEAVQGGQGLVEID
ncbi:MAG: biotin/lipoyl-binding protein [Propionibacteriaceae bacterium]|jgi:methylmalonyl-CoA carboxyltransferase small subunit|nr:biotin/lipoyl-binding protein [Propionibacteriaceae bacterium]